MLWPRDAKNQLIGKDLMLRKTEGRRRRRRQRMRWLDSNTNLRDMNLSKPWEIMKEREAWSAAVYRVAKSWIDSATEQQHTIKQDSIYSFAYSFIQQQSLSIYYVQGIKLIGIQSCVKSGSHPKRFRF